MEVSNGNYRVRGCLKRPAEAWRWSGRCGFTLIELLVVIAIIAVLAALLVPALKRARLSAMNASCVSNIRQIATAMLLYVGDTGGHFPIATESPYKFSVHGRRTLPLILHEEGYLRIDEPATVWRCPLDRRTAKRHFLAYYYYYEGGPGNRFEAPYSGMQGSYSINGVFRFFSERSPNSYLEPPSGSWKIRRRNLSAAATPTHTVWFFDSGWAWGVNANSPWQLFYEFATLEYLTLPGRSAWDHPYGQLRRHDPSIWPDPNNVENIGPFGNMCFIDGHVQTGIDFFDTSDISPPGNPADDPLAVKWWSMTGK